MYIFTYICIVDTQIVCLQLDSFLGYLGLEPRAYRLKAEYSTIELVTLQRKIKSKFFILNIHLYQLFFKIKNRFLIYKTYLAIPVMFVVTRKRFFFFFTCSQITKRLLNKNFPYNKSVSLIIKSVSLIIFCFL